MSQKYTFLYLSIPYSTDKWKLLGQFTSNGMYSHAQVDNVRKLPKGKWQNEGGGGLSLVIPRTLMLLCRAVGVLVHSSPVYSPGCWWWGYSGPLTARLSQSTSAAPWPAKKQQQQHVDHDCQTVSLVHFKSNPGWINLGPRSVERRWVEIAIQISSQMAVHVYTHYLDL